MSGRLVFGSGYAANTQPSWRLSRRVFIRVMRLNLMSESLKSNSGWGGKESVGAGFPGARASDAREADGKDDA